MKHLNDIDPADVADHWIGLEIVRVLGLRRKRRTGRIETTYGDKNPCGLTRTLRSLTGDSERIASLEATLRGLLDAYAPHRDITHPDRLQSDVRRACEALNEIPS